MLAHANRGYGFPGRVAAVLGFAALAAWAAPVRAGVGAAVSPAIPIDTTPPSLVVDQFPATAFFRAGDRVTLHWTTNDRNPGTLPEHFLAWIQIEDEIHSTYNYLHHIGDVIWKWTVPDMTSANVQLGVMARDAFGNTTVGTSNKFTILSSVTDVPAAPPGLELARPAPNPFNPSTRLQFVLPESGSVHLAVYDARGHRIRTLLNADRPAGDFTAFWDGRSDRGRAQPGGVYFFVLEFRGPHHSGRVSRKAVLIP